MIPKTEGMLDALFRGIAGEGMQYRAAKTIKSLESDVDGLKSALAEMKERMIYWNEAALEYKRQLNEIIKGVGCDPED